MSATVEKFLEAFDALPTKQQHQAAVEILRRFLPAGEGDVPEAALIDSAHELFLALDAEEAEHAER